VRKGLFTLLFVETFFFAAAFLAGAAFFPATFLGLCAAVVMA
jgi:hypothetical protein